MRNASRTAPSSNVRCTAISVSGGWLQSDAANAISSSAAATRVVDGRARRNSPPAARPACRPAPARSSSVASTICTSVDQPSDRHAEKAAAETPSAPCLRAIAGSLFQNTKAPGHRPFARLGRLLEHERIGRIEPYGAQELHARGPSSAGSNQAGCGEPRQRTSCASTSRLAHAADQQIAILVDVAPDALLAQASARDSSSPPRRSRSPARRRQRA